jgi:sarcosine oxidase, subunit beta
MAKSAIGAADVVVIGGGIMGLSTAWNLARRGAGKIVVLERAVVAAGATGKTGALLRQHYSNEPEARLAHLSLQVFKNWSEIIGGDCGYDPTGLVFTVEMGPGGEENAGRLRRNVAMQNSIGIDSRVVTPAELKELQPFGAFDDLTIAAYEPASGYVDSIATARTLAHAAIREGVKLRERTGIRSIKTVGDRIAGVETDDGLIATNTVVCAAGPWSTSLLAGVGVAIPVTALRVQIAIVQRPLDLEPPHFVYLDTINGMFCRPWGPGRSLIGVGGGDQHDEVDPENYDARNDPGYGELAIAAGSKRMPAMANGQYLHGHAGLYDMSPDAHPIIGLTPLEGLYLAAGFSGAGFKKGPAVGQCLAELIVNGASTTADLTPFRLTRFDVDGWQAPWGPDEYVMTSDFGHKF